MLQRQTQTAAFWRDQFEVTSDDVDFLFDLLLDSQEPMTISRLATALIDEYLRKENAKIETELTKGEVYLPNKHYSEGETLVFPALDFAVGTVLEIREGHNPEHGPFNVAKIHFTDTDEEREFAIDLKSPHRLNDADGSNLLNNKSLLSADEIYTLYQEEIEESMLYTLDEGERSDEFVEVNGNWLLKDMLAEINTGHLNIAEALIEVAGKPQEAAQLISELDLDNNVSEAMQILSLNHALSKDGRFALVGTSNGELWYLQRMIPAQAINIPITLRPTQPTYNRALLSVELLQIEWELDDEWGESSLTSGLPAIVPSTGLTLTYPHRSAGTIPLNGRTRNFFPVKESGCSVVNLIDGRWGTQIEGWVVHEGRYVTGLKKWMDDHALPVGAQITLERTNKANEVVIDYRTRRSKREWTRVATADLEQQKLFFEMNKIPVACEYDEYLIVSESEAEPIAQLRRMLNQNRIELTRIVEDLVPELAKLSPQGTVHVKSIYSAANMLRRCAPGPVFYSLISNRKFRDVGNGYFALA